MESKLLLWSPSKEQLRQILWPTGHREPRNKVVYNSPTERFIEALRSGVNTMIYEVQMIHEALW